ncbi:3138_t:CDS:2, partial [Racocetra persica]
PSPSEITGKFSNKNRLDIPIPSILTSSIPNVLSSLDSAVLAVSSTITDAANTATNSARDIAAVAPSLLSQLLSAFDNFKPRNSANISALYAIPLTFYCTRFVPIVASFNTSIANIVFKVSVLQGLYAEITSTGEYSNGSTFAVTQITSAEPLCYSDVAGIQDTRESSVWFLSSQRWVWSSLMTNFSWNLSC